MPIEIIVPRLGWSMEEGAFVAWLKKDGEFVESGDRLFSIEGDKAIQEIESIDSGILRIAPDAPKPSDPIRVGDVLGHLISADEAVPKPAPKKTTKTTTEDEEHPPSPRPSPPGEGASRRPSFDTPHSALRTPTAPTISPRALRAATELGVDWTTFKGSGRTGRIRERDVRAASGTKAESAPSPQPSPLRGRGRPEGELAANPSPRGRGQGEGGLKVLVTAGCGCIAHW